MTSALAASVLAAATAYAAEDQQLQFAVVAENPKPTLAEPLVIYVSLKNLGTAPAQITTRLEPEYGFVKFFVALEGAPEVVFVPWVFKETGVSSRSLEPGATYSAPVKLFFGARGWTFPRPGHYQLRATYGGLEASASITVVAPQSPPDQEAAALLLESKDVGYFLLLGGGDDLSDAIARLQRVSSGHPESPLAGYANFALGLNLSRDFPDFSKGAMRRADPGTARTYLEQSTQAAAMKGSAFFTLQAYDNLASIYERTGDHAQAEAIRLKLADHLKHGYADLEPSVIEGLRERSQDY